MSNLTKQKDEKVKNEVHEIKFESKSQRYFDGADKVNSKSVLEEADQGFADPGNSEI